MATQTFWIDAPSFSSATAAYLDSNLTICAPNGYYSDGLIVRQQVNCLLLPQETCGTCLPPCGEAIAGSGETGIYRLQLDTGTTLGAIIIRFDPFAVPDGIRAILGTTTYNKVSTNRGGSVTIGAQGLPGHFTIVGSSSINCVPFTSQNLALFEYDIVNGFVDSGTTIPWQVDPADMFLSNPTPGYVTLVVPKTNISNTVITVEAIGPCDGTAWDISVACPVQLTPYLRSSRADTFTAACALPPIQNYYFVSAQQTVTPTEIKVADFAFTDPNGANALPAGFYRVNNAGANEVIEVVNGMVVQVYNCP